LYQAHQGEIFTPGAPVFAFDQLFSNPVFLYHGTGTPVKELKVFEGPQVYQGLALPTNAYQGVPVGVLALQGLIDSEPSLQ